jgi:chemotaxis signal transduction protein
MRYVSFRLGKEMYALDIWQAREIVDAPLLNQLPNAPAWHELDREFKAS